jgi:hypothetical protein
MRIRIRSKRDHDMAETTRTTECLDDVTGAKHGRLERGALTYEVMDSSPSVLGRSRGGAVRGLQQ